MALLRACALWLALGGGSGAPSLYGWTISADKAVLELTGGAFTAGARVCFTVPGGATANGTNVTLVSDSVLRVAAPAGLTAGELVVTVVDDGGGGGTRSNEMTIEVLAMPVIATVDPAEGSITGGALLTLRGNWTACRYPTNALVSFRVASVTALVAPTTLADGELTVVLPLIDVTEEVDLGSIARGTRLRLATEVRVSMDGGQTFSAAYGGPFEVLVAPQYRLLYVYAGPITDLGYNYNWNTARREHATFYGSYVSAEYLESQSEEAASVMNLTTAYCNMNYEVILGTSFLFLWGMHPTSETDACNFWTNDDGSLDYSRPYPTYFVHGGGYLQTATFSTMFTKIYQLRYVVGVLAGKYLEDKASKVVGYMGAFPIGEVIRGMNAFARGCRSVLPECEVKVMWLGTWFDDHIERSAAMKLWVEDGARFITQHSNSIQAQIVFGGEHGPPACADLDETPLRAACMDAAEVAATEAYPQRGVAVGYNKDATALGGDYVLTSVLITWTEAAKHYLDKVFSDTWEPHETHWPGSHDDPAVNELKPFSPLVTATQARATLAAYESIKTEGDRVFCGALKLKDGVTPVPTNHTTLGHNFEDASGHACDNAQVTAGVCCLTDFPGKTHMTFMMEGLSFATPTEGKWGKMEVDNASDWSDYLASTKTGFYAAPRAGDITCPGGLEKRDVQQGTVTVRTCVLECGAGARLDLTTTGATATSVVSSGSCVSRPKEDKNSLSEGLQALMIILVVVNVAFSIFCASWTYHFSDRVILKLSQPKFLYWLCLGCLVSTSSSIAPLFGKRTVACQLMVWLYGAGFIITTATLYVKMQSMNERIDYSLQMHQSSLSSKKNVASSLGKVLRVLGIMCTGEIAILAAWFAVAPLHSKRSCSEREKGGVWNGACTKSTRRCRTTYGPAFVSTLCAYHVCCILAGIHMCWRTRNLPSLMAEGKWVFTSFYSQLQVFVTAVPVLATVLDNYATFTLLKSLVICVVDLGTLAMIFLPKMALVHKYGDFSGFAVCQYVTKMMSESTQKDHVYDQLRAEPEQKKGAAANSTSTNLYIHHSSESSATSSSRVAPSIIAMSTELSPADQAEAKS